MTNENWLANLAAKLPRHSEISPTWLEVSRCPRWRWLSVSCSLGRGRGDELSDIDAGVGYAEPLAIDELERTGAQLVAAAGDVVDVLVHQLDGWPDDTRRFAVEYPNGVQLDLVIFPSHLRSGIIQDEEVSVVDKDGNLADPLTSRLFGAPDRLAREWVMLGWWAVSDIAKYLTRGSLFEAAVHIDMVREEGLRLYAAGRGIPYPVYGLTSLLDYPPFELPERLASTYCAPHDRASVVRAAGGAADLLATSATQAALVLGCDLSTPWAVTARARLDAASVVPITI